MNVKRLFNYLGLVLLATGCYQFNKPKKPKNLISKEKMVEVLIDIKLITSATGTNRKILDKHGIDQTTFVFTKHNIDSLQFASSNNYYAYHVKEYEAIYNKVKDSLEQLKKFYEALDLKEKEEAKAKAKKKRDSIKQIATADSLKLITSKDALKKPIQIKNIAK